MDRKGKLIAGCVRRDSVYIDTNREMTGKRRVKCINSAKCSAKTRLRFRIRLGKAPIGPGGCVWSGKVRGLPFVFA